eukprot:2445499-Pyramimonas_sp.AAC.1
MRRNASYFAGLVDVDKKDSIIDGRQDAARRPLLRGQGAALHRRPRHCVSRRRERRGGGFRDSSNLGRVRGRSSSAILIAPSLIPLAIISPASGAACSSPYVANTLKSQTPSQARPCLSTSCVISVIRVGRLAATAFPAEAAEERIDAPLDSVEVDADVV